MSDDSRFFTPVFTVTFVLILSALILANYLVFSYSNDYKEERYEWDTNQHECPKCDWVGYTGDMEFRQYGIPIVKEWYCPDCGYMLKRV